MENTDNIDMQHKSFEDWFIRTYGKMDDYSLSSLNKKDRQSRLLAYDLSRSAFFQGIRSVEVKD